MSVVQKPDFLLIPHSFQGDCIITSPKEPDKQLWDGPFTQGSKSPQTHKVQWYFIWRALKIKLSTSPPTVSLLTPTQTFSSPCCLNFHLCAWKVPCHLLDFLVECYFAPYLTTTKSDIKKLTTSPFSPRVGNNTTDIPKLAFSQYIPVVKAVALWPLGIKHVLESLALPSHALMEPQDSWGRPGVWCEMTSFVNDKERLLDNVLLNPTCRRKR